jgi:hypothetical protein
MTANENWIDLHRNMQLDCDATRAPLIDPEVYGCVFCRGS